MAYVITQSCCSDASCVPACPVDCIRPVGAAPDATSAQMLYIDPEACIDCGACVDECPVNAIFYEEDLPPQLELFKEINAAYFHNKPLESEARPATNPRPRALSKTLRVAIVGAGPAGCYAAAELVGVDGVEVELFDRLPTPFGLIRSGVAPDHQHTKSITKSFDHLFANKQFRCHFNVDVGRDITHDELIAHHHAVIYATGASTSRALGIPGEDLAGAHPAADFVGWYNGHPDHAGHTFNLGTPRAVVVGNGNVALDVARMLLTEPARLAATDIAQPALDALSQSTIEEVLILGRRSLRHAAFSAGEFLALGNLEGIDVIIDGHQVDDVDQAGDELDVETAFKLRLAREYARRPATPGNKRIVFQFSAVPMEISGAQQVEKLRIARADTKDDAWVETSLVLRSIGYQGVPQRGLPFDAGKAVIPNDQGRVIDEAGRPLPGTYVTGWIKRGPRGVIGTNRACAQETVAQLWTDYAEGTLDNQVQDGASLTSLLLQRGITTVGWEGWRAIDDAERERGARISRPRVKFTVIPEMLTAATKQPTMQ